MAPPAVLLSDYLQSLRDILHEQNDNFASQAAKIRWINRGLLMRDIVTKYNRVLKSVPVTIYIAPAPSQAFTMEFDCAKYSSPLVLTTDADTLPYPYTEPVPYYAAYLFKLNERQNDEAQDFLDSFWMACAVATGERTGALRNAYTGDRRFA